MRLTTNAVSNLTSFKHFHKCVITLRLWGKLEKSAFGPSRLKADTIASFSSTMLSMVTIMYLFLEEFVKDVLPKHFEVYEYLYHIIGILRMGPERAMEYTLTLQRLMVRHLDAFVELYTNHVSITMGSFGGAS